MRRSVEELLEVCVFYNPAPYSRQHIISFPVNFKLWPANASEKQHRRNIFLYRVNFLCQGQFPLSLLPLVSIHLITDSTERGWLALGKLYQHPHFGMGTLNVYAYFACATRYFF